MVPESKLEKTEHGLVPKSEGWFVLDMRDAEWRHVDGRGAVCVVADDFEGWRQLDQLGVNPFVLRSGEPMAMYHWKADREDFLVVSGEAVLIIEAGVATARVVLRALSTEHEARDRRRRKRSVPRDRGGCSRARRRAGVSRLHDRRGREAPRCQRRRGDDGWGRRVRLRPAPRADRLPRRLASRVAGEQFERAAGSSVVAS